MGDLNYRKVFWDTSRFLESTGERGREKFFTELSVWLSKRDGLEDEMLERTNREYEIDYSNNLDKVGGYYVYAWVDRQGNIFYIGQGGLRRVLDKSSRNGAFKKRSAGAMPFILAYHCNKTTANDIESLCIKHTQLLGCDLINIRGTFNYKEIRYFLMKTFSSNKVAENLDWDRKYEDYVYLKETYPEVATSLDKMISDDLQIGCVPEKESIKNEPTTFWTIDGVKKPRRDWCKEYNISVGTVYGRMKHGLTIKQALSFPKVPVERTRDPMVYWKEQGFI